MISSVFESTKIINSGNALDPVGFVEAIFQGLAPDGGLYYPTEYACLQDIIVSLPKDISFIELAATITHSLFSEEFSKQEAKTLCTQAFKFQPVLRSLNDEIMLLELFHGPSCAFKDFGAAYLSAIMEQQLSVTDEQITILTATSGDTGSAVAQAFYNKKNIKVVILYPSGRVSPLQEKQLTSVGKNIYALEVQGSFDDCQYMVKQAFQDTKICTQYNLSSANSINIGRLIPQSFYYIYAWNILRHQKQSYHNKFDDWLFCTPSGNFGNISAGLLAKCWGLPIKHIIAASNANDVVPKYLSSGTYTPMASFSTLANAMDVGNPSNFERMYTMYKKQAMTHTHNITDITEQEIHKEMAHDIRALSISDKKIQDEILEIQQEYGEYICPHTATGISASKQILKSDWAKKLKYQQAVVLCTAHPGKFFEVIENICGSKPPLPSRLEQFLHKQSLSYKILPTVQAMTTVLDKLL